MGTAVLLYGDLCMIEKLSIKEAISILNAERHRLTQQQYRTLKGQIYSGDIKGALIGLRRLRGATK